MDQLLERRVAKILPTREGLSKLIQDRKIRLYQGFDPTGSRLHIGHAIGLRKLNEFVEAGHEVIILFGTGTVLVGDPSLRETARATIKPEEIEQNIRTWKEQVAKVLDLNKVTIKQNGDWISNLTMTQLVEIASHVSAVQLFKRESFTRRLERGDTVWFHETLYPLLQGYDSVVLDVDLEIGGTDQEFNMLMGRELLKKMKNKEKYVLTTPMIVGTDGQPMSKSSGNCVWLDDPAPEMYGKLMSLRDENIVDYLWNATELEADEVRELEAHLKAGTNPRDIKARMAFEVTRLYHGEAIAQQARDQFVSQFGRGEVPVGLREVKLPTGDVSAVKTLVAAGLADSNSAARRLLEQGGVRLNQQLVDSDTITLKEGDVLSTGKRNFVKVVV